MSAAVALRRGPGGETVALAGVAVVACIALGAVTYVGAGVHPGARPVLTVGAATVGPLTLAPGTALKPVPVAQSLGYLTIAGTSVTHVAVVERGLDTQGRMEVAPGGVVTHYSRSAPLGGTTNTVFYAPSSVLGGLETLHKGDAISVESAGGPVFHFVLDADPRLVDAADVTVLQSGTTPRLTIFTDGGAAGAKQRLLVLAVPAPAAQ